MIRSSGKKWRRHVTALALLVLLALVLAGCGKGAGGDSAAPMASPSPAGEGYASNQAGEQAAYDYDRGFDYPAEAEEEKASYDEAGGALAGEDDSDANGEDGLLEQKLVYTASMGVETLEFETSRELLLNLIAEHQGIIQSQNFYDDTSLTRYNDNDYKRRNLTVVARIPSAGYDAFINSVGSIGYIRSSNARVDNISQRYYDTQARLNSLRIQEERLLEMMRQATTVEAMIQVEAALSGVQYEIDRNTTELKYMDHDVAYSTVTIDLTEVHEYSYVPTHRLSFWERLKDNVAGSWNFLLDALEGLLVLVIYVLPFAVIAGLVILMVRRIVRYRRQKKE